MQVNKKKGNILNMALRQWAEEGVITAEDADRLSHSIQINPFDWKRLARYSFWAAIICGLIAITAVLTDDFLVRVFRELFTAPPAIKSLFFATLSGVFYFGGIRRKKRFPEKIYSNEAQFFLGVISTAAAVTFLGAALDTGSGHYSILFLLATLIYGALGLWFPSTLIWVFALVSLGSWFGAETGYISGWGAYYLGMNYPMRFILLGLVLTFAGSFVFNHWPAKAGFLKPTRATGLLYLFIALWLMSIFGNYGSMESWYNAERLELFHWSLLFGLAAVASIYHGLKYDDGMTRGFGLTFLLINLYTRFFEYFWDSTHKAIFFALLALSFWYIGSRAESVWHLKMLNSRK